MGFSSEIILIVKPQCASKDFMELDHKYKINLHNKYYKKIVFTGKLKSMMFIQWSSWLWFMKNEKNDYF